MAHPAHTEALAVFDLRPGMDIMVIDGGRVALEGAVLEVPREEVDEGYYKDGTVRAWGMVLPLDALQAGLVCTRKGEWVEDVFTVPSNSLRAEQAIEDTAIMDDMEDWAERSEGLPMPIVAHAIFSEYPVERVVGIAFMKARRSIHGGKDPVLWLEAARIAAQSTYNFGDEKINEISRRCSDLRAEWEKKK